MFVLDGDDRLLYASPAFEEEEEASGFPAEALLNDSQYLRITKEIERLPVNLVELVPISMRMANMWPLRLMFFSPAVRPTPSCADIPPLVRADWQ